MSVRTRAVIELSLAVVAAMGSVGCWLAASSTVATAPVLATEPSKVSTVYDPAMIAAAFLLATLAGVLAVIGIARLRRK